MLPFLLADATAGDYAAGGLVGAILIAVPALGTWIRSLLKDRAEQRERATVAEQDAKEKAAKLEMEMAAAKATIQRSAAADAAAAWEKYSQATVQQLREEIERVQKESSGRASRMNEELKARDDRIDKLEESERKCQEEHKATAILAAKQEEQIKGLHADLRRLFAHVGGGVPGVTTPAFITAGAEDGIIVDCTAQAGPMFHWLRPDLIGQNIEVLIPPELRQAHWKAFGEVARGERDIDPEKVIAATAMRRNGERFPVLIALTSFVSKASGKRFIGAEIKDDVYGRSPPPGAVELAGPKAATLVLSAGENRSSSPGGSAEEGPAP